MNLLESANAMIRTNDSRVYPICHDWSVHFPIAYDTEFQSWIIRIPVEKILLFRTESRKENPEGRSILRNAYRSWYYKKKIQEIEGIGIERDLVGFPLLIAPEGMDIWAMPDKFAEAMSFVQNIRRDAMEGFVLPGGWELKLLSSGGSQQLDTRACW